MFEFFYSFQQYNDWGLLALRIGISAIFFYHGFGKWKLWKPDSTNQTPASMKTLLRFLSIVEPLGAIAVLFGFLTQFAAFGLTIIMIGATYFKMRTWKVPFSSATHTGWEMDLILFVSAVSLFFSGAGTLSLDRIILGL